jgi:hypothetical protein
MISFKEFYLEEKAGALQQNPGLLNILAAKIGENFSRIF